MQLPDLSLETAESHINLIDDIEEEVSTCSVLYESDHIVLMSNGYGPIGLV